MTIPDQYSAFRPTTKISQEGNRVHVDAIRKQLAAFEVQAAAMVTKVIKQQLESLEQNLSKTLRTAILNVIGIKEDSWGKCEFTSVNGDKSKNIIYSIVQAKVKGCFEAQVSAVADEVLADPETMNNIRKGLLHELKDKISYNWRNEVNKAIEKELYVKINERVNVIRDLGEYTISISEIKEKYDLTDERDFHGVLGEIILEHLVATKIAPALYGEDGSDGDAQQ